MFIKILLLFVELVMLVFSLTYNLHMFQLNGYKNMEHRRWLTVNIKKQGVLVPLGITVLLVFAFDNILTELLLCIIAVVALVYYRYLNKTNTKKKLVYTNRVKRLILTECVLILIVSVGLFVAGFELVAWNVFFGVVTILQPWLLIGVNICNKPIEQGINQYYISDAKKKLNSVKNITVIGVTGSYGKTSVKYFLGALLQEKYNVLITPESYNTPMGVVRTIREQLKPTHQIFVCEMGARNKGDIKELCGIVHPQHGIITAIGPQHLETFGTIEEISNTKFELADALPEGGMLFLNTDNAYISAKKDSYSNVIGYSEANVDGYYADEIKVSSLGTEFRVVAPTGETEAFQMSLVGSHNVINVLGAIAVSHKMGIALKELKIPVRRIKPVEHRMQLTKHGNVTIIDDAYNSNPVGSKAAVETLAMFDGVKILITPGMVELGKEEAEFNYKFGTYAAKCCDYIYLVGKHNSEIIYKGVMDSGFSADKCRICKDLEEALKYAYGITTEKQKYILLENDLPDNY